MSAPRLKLFVRPERRFVPVGATAEMRVVVRVIAASPTPPSRVNLGLAIDASGTMAGFPMERARAAVVQAIRALRPDDTFSLVAFGERAQTILPPTDVAEIDDPEQLAGSLVAAGRSAFYPGWLACGLNVAQAWDRFAVNRVLVVSDGAERLGAPDDEVVVRAARGLHRRGISTSVVGLGTRFDEDLLVRVAIDGGGRAWHAPTARQLVDGVERETSDLHRIAAEWSTLRFETDHAEVVDITNDLPWIGANQVAIPPLYGGQAFTVVVRLKVAPVPRNGDVTPLSVRLKMLDSAGGESAIERRSMNIHVVAPEMAERMERDSTVAAAHARLELAVAAGRTIDALDAGDRSAATQIWETAVAALDTVGHIGAPDAISVEGLSHAKRVLDVLRTDAPTREARVSLRFAQTDATRAEAGNALA